jgi:hypothetical protein
MRWNIHLWILMRRLTEGKWCAWADRSTGRHCTVSWWHHTMDHGLLMMLLLLLLFAVEAAALQVWTQRTEVVSVLRVVMVRWHVLITHASERRRLQTEVAKEGQGPADWGWC